MAFLGFVASAIYGLLFCLPLKIRIWKKHGFYLSYQEMTALETQGDPRVIQLRKRTKVMLLICAAGVASDFLFHLFR